MDMKNLVGLEQAIPAVILASLVALGLGYLFTSSPLSQLPFVGLEIGNEEKRRLAYLASAKTLYQAGYHKFKNGVFRITTSRTVPIVVVHSKFLPELNKLPDSTLSVEDAVNESMEAKYTKLSTIPIIPHAIKTMLTPALTRLSPIVAEEIQQSMDRELPPCNDWTAINIHSTLLRIVATASGRIFVGPKVCRNDKYLDASINFTADVMGAQNAVQQVKQWLRPFLANRLPEVQKLNRQRKAAQEILRPIIQERREQISSQVAEKEKPDDMLQWLMDAQPGASDSVLTEQQLGVSFAAIHTTTLVSTNAFFNLAAMPEVANEIREEVRDALARHDGSFSSKALQDMKKMDSFLKETLRYHPFAFATYQRKVLKTFKLSTGQIIPAGVTIECPTYAISYDNANFPGADKFDALRFYRLREQATGSDGATQNQFVSVSQNSLAFGHGRHACPGRFFAGNELKIAVSNVLLRYEMRNMSKGEGRYPNMEFAQMSIPDPTKSIMLKKIA